MNAVALRDLEETKIKSSHSCSKSSKITQDEALFAARSRVKAHTREGLKIIQTFTSKFSDRLPPETRQQIAFFNKNSPQLTGDGSTNIAEYKQTLRDCYRCISAIKYFIDEKQPFKEETQQKVDKALKDWIFRAKTLTTPEHALRELPSTALKNVWTAPKARSPRELLTYAVDAVGFLEGEFGDIPQAQNHPKIVSMLIEARDKGLDGLSDHCSEEAALDIAAEISPVLHYAAGFLGKGIAGFLAKDDRNQNVAGYFKGLIHQIDAQIGLERANHISYDIVENAKPLPFHPVMGLRGSSHLVIQHRVQRVPQKKVGFLGRLIAR